MPFITSVELFCPDQKTQECGMQWDPAMSVLENFLKRINATNEQNRQKIEKESLFTIWPSFIIQWVHNLSKRP